MARWNVHLIPVTPQVRAALPHATFADSWCASGMAPCPAWQAAQAIFGAPPPRVFGWLMQLRHALVAPLGLKTSELRANPPGPANAGDHSRIGPFPVWHESADQVVLGLDDKHLDFRIVVRAQSAPAQGGGMITVSTLVAEHNALGRAYMVLVKPFHRWLSRRMLARAAFAPADV